MADAMLVTMIDNSVISKTLPGKVQTYMAVGKPIIGAINGETQYIIKDSECGFCGPAEDAALLKENVDRFINMQNKEILGVKAKYYYTSKFSKQRVMSQLENELINIAQIT